MRFTADRQTLDDLNLTGRYRPDSIFSLFNHTRTAGGEKLLEEMFLHPLQDAEEINRRSATFRYFHGRKVSFPFTRAQFEMLENYIRGAAYGNFLMALTGNARRKVLASTVRDPQYARLQADIQNAAAVLANSYHLLNALIEPENPMMDRLHKVKYFLDDKRLGWLKESPGENLSLLTLTKYDYLLRRIFINELKELVEAVYYLDVCIAVAGIAETRNFSYAKAYPKERNIFNAKALRHPALNKAIGNHLSFYGEHNLLFLTGANMAGKSTLMKAFGITVYLAHMGFPLAATDVEFSVKDGIYSSINVADNLNRGYSHFYAEVLRVKKIAEEVSGSKDMIVLFDELFKGTNVKDAFDATVAVTGAFALYSNCFFIISTHIVEAGESLRKKCGHIRFAYLPTVMKESTPEYTYKLEEGISSDRQGMIILHNEGIFEILQAETN